MDPMHMIDALTFTQAEAEALILALSRGQHAFTTREVMELTDWAQETRCRYVMLSLALQGKIGLSVQDGEVTACPLRPPLPDNIRRLHDRPPFNP